VINNNVKTAWIFTAGYSVSNIKKAQLIPRPYDAHNLPIHQKLSFDNIFLYNTYKKIA
jgi:hypothetical protein